ncbi:arginine utilization regulatory protein [Clostridiales Family XIII bacterium PM5-7]
MEMKDNKYMNSVDYVLVVNKDFEIIYHSRFDNRMSQLNPLDRKMGKYKNLFEMYPKLGRNNSSIAKTMSSGEVIYNDAQKFVDINGNIYVTQNVTYPIFNDGQIIGVVELTKDVTNVKHLKGKREYLSNIEDKRSASNINEPAKKITFDDIWTLDENLLRSIEQAKMYSTYMNPTLIYGETGTGKELFAQAMINYGAAPKQKIVVQNCAAVPDNLIESILFGTTKGSYTGAENRKGLFEEADGGIFFMDELNAMPYQVQGKLLRVVQEGTFWPIGSNTEKHVDVKIIAAMNVDPIKAIENNALRRDLFYRLSSSMIYLPPLRERKQDIEYLTDRYIDLFNETYGKEIEGISEELRDVFMNYSWEGNVRELKHVIEAMVSLSNDKVLTVDHIPVYLHNKIKESNGEDGAFRERTTVKVEEEDDVFVLGADNCDLKDALAEVEKKMIIRTLRQVNGNKTKAGKILGIPRQTLKYKMDKLGIEDAER